MKVAVTSQGTRMDSPVDPRFGRAAFFIVVDTESGKHSSHDNTQNLNAVQGAGIQAAHNVVRLGVEAVITGNVGPKAFKALEAGGVKVYTGTAESVGEAIEQFQAGRLQSISKPNVGGHWV